MSDCPECVPGAPTPKPTMDDYRRALDALAAREDLTPEQRQQATDYLERHKPSDQEQTA